MFLTLGAEEYIPCDDEAKLDEFDYIHRCYKFDEDVELTLVPLRELKRPLLRTGTADRLLLKHSVIEEKQLQVASVKI